MRERRSELRLLCADMVEVSWQDQAGRQRRTTALLEDIAPSGACLQFEVAVPLGTTLRIECPTGVLGGRVRYCVYREIGYFVGLEFGENSRWSRQQFEPQHLLDPQKLIANTRKGGAKKPN